MNDLSSPPLQAPGAGIPVPERYVGKVMLQLRCLTGSADSFNNDFIAERDKVRFLIRPLAGNQLSQQVLIPRPIGLEDSSRFWSVWMTLDHLRIVQRGVLEIVRQLLAGVKPSRQVSTAAVKPNLNVGGEVVQQFEDSCDAILAQFRSIDYRQGTLAHPHPWFGPLDVKGWHALVAFHLGLHRRQIASIIRGLSSIEGRG